jgi:alpha-beta hydrolase superfamily lysophospholipase
MAVLMKRFVSDRYWLMLSVCLLLSACSRPFFYPDQQIRLTPDKIGVKYRDVTLETKDGIRVHAWHLLTKESPKGVILVLHGNAENISTHIHSVAWLVGEGYELLLLDYRGYGLSEGRPSLPEVFYDLDAASAWLTQRSNEQQIPAYWLGQSIGASLSAHYLANNGTQNIRAVILDTPFASYQRIGREKLSEFWLTWPVQYPLSWLIDNRYSPEKSVPHWPSTPLLVYTSLEDYVIPSHHTLQLIERFPEANAEIKLIETHLPHIATYSDSGHRQETLDFLDKYQR